MSAPGARSRNDNDKDEAKEDEPAGIVQRHRWLRQKPRGAAPETQQANLKEKYECAQELLSI